MPNQSLICVPKKHVLLYDWASDGWYRDPQISTDEFSE